MTIKRHCLSVIPSAPTPLPIIRQSSISSTSSISLMKAAMKFAILLYGTKENMPVKINCLSNANVHVFQLTIPGCGSGHGGGVLVGGPGPGPGAPLLQI